MREIKCRAWDKDLKKWIAICPYIIPTEGDGKTFRFETTDNVEVVWFTGLKDKNDKEIYEGDIVKTAVGKHLWWYLVTTDSNFGGNNLYLITRYRNFRHIDVEDEIEWGDFFVNECRDTLTEYNANKNLEVIGNIYENEDLLK